MGFSWTAATRQFVDALPLIPRPIAGRLRAAA
jgi:hypothetical protein